MTSFNATVSAYVVRRKSLWLLIGLLAAAVLAARAQAESVPDLYAVSVPVSEQSQAELQRAAGVGLHELAVRIAGRSSAANDPALAPLFASGTRYLEQYRYERNPDASLSGSLPWRAQLRFAPAQIDAELRKAGLPVWGNNRPALTTVIVADNNGTPAVIDDSSPLANTLREQWHRRGLVLHLPPVASAVNVDDVAQLDTAKVAAAIPEHADGLLIGRVVLLPGGNCESHWLLSLNTQASGVGATDPGTGGLSANTTGNELSACVAGALDQIVDNLSPQYAVAADGHAEGVVLRVTGIVNFNDYAALLNYLRRLGAIRDVQPVSLRSDEMLFQLKIDGSTEQLARQLALESRLTPTEVLPAGAPANSPLPVTLGYRWTMAPN